MSDSTSSFAGRFDACPKCGYKPASPDDPLLTAHNGEGECPSCGIIPARFDKGKTLYPERAVRTQSAQPETDSKESQMRQRTQFSFPVKTMLVGLLLVGAIAYYYSRHNKTTPSDETSSIDQPSDSLGGHAASDRVPDSILKIAPGEERAFTLSGYLPFFQGAEQDPLDFAPRWALVEKIAAGWEARGVKIALKDSIVAPESATLWAFRSEGEENWRPLWANRQMNFNRKFMTFRVGRALQPDFKAPRITGCTDMMALKKFAEMPQSKAEEILKMMVGGSPELKQYNCYLYRTDLTFSVSVPSGGDFSATAPIYNNICAFTLNGVNSEDFGINLADPAQFDMNHEANTEGIVLKQNSYWSLKYSE